MFLLYTILGFAGLLILLGAIATVRIIFYPSHIKKKTDIGSIFELDITKINIKSADNVRLLSPEQIEKIQKGDY
ncbi:MAG: hypothetical protein VCD00_16100 [Candidatus Hydrogenedentota bacterium]